MPACVAVAQAATAAVRAMEASESRILQAFGTTASVAEKGVGEA